MQHDLMHQRVVENLLSMILEQLVAIREALESQPQEDSEPYPGQTLNG